MSFQELLLTGLALMILIPAVVYVAGFTVATAYYALIMRSLATDDLLNAMDLARYWPETVLERVFGTSV